MNLGRRLADRDKDNALAEEEFCVALKLVLLRRKGYNLPASLPDTLWATASEYATVFLHTCLCTSLLSSFS